MPDFTPTRSDAIRSALIARIADDLHRTGTKLVRREPSRGVGTARSGSSRRQGPQLAGWAAVAVAVVLVGAVAGTAIITTLNRGSHTTVAVSPTTSPSDSTPSPVAGTSGDIANWELRDPDAVTAESVVLALAVTRLGCASGVTGEVLEPRITYEAQRILIQVDVAPLERTEGQAYTCLSNNAVPVTIELTQPIGERELIDQACLEGNASTTAPCMTATRWP